MNAVFVALATDLQWRSMSSNTISLVSSIPSATMARLSPTRTMSMPAWSATCPLGKSCAVIMAMGSPFLRIERSVFIVTFFLCDATAAPMGECELFRHCNCESTGRAANEAGLQTADDREEREVRARELRTVVRDIGWGWRCGDCLWEMR